MSSGGGSGGGSGPAFGGLGGGGHAHDDDDDEEDENEGQPGESWFAGGERRYATSNLSPPMADHLLVGSPFRTPIGLLPSPVGT